MVYAKFINSQRFKANPKNADLENSLCVEEISHKRLDDQSSQN